MECHIFEHTGYTIELLSAKREYQYTVGKRVVESPLVQVLYSKKNGWHISDKGMSNSVLYDAYKYDYGELVTKNKEIANMDPKLYKAIWIRANKVNYTLYKGSNEIGSERYVKWIEIERTVAK